MQYSCATPRAVSLAFGAPNDMPQSEIRFANWSPGLTAN